MKVRRPDLTIGTTDHSIPIHDRSLPILDKIAEAQLHQFEASCTEFDIPFYGTGCVFEFTGSAIRALSMEERMTICNMSIEGGARAGLIAPDHTTYRYLAGRPAAPQGADWGRALNLWRQLPSDPGSVYGKTIHIDAASLEPMITFGTNPGMGIGITAPVPDHAARRRIGQIPYG